MNAPLEPAHSPFGGSVAARVLRCPASVGLIEKVPAHLRKVSAYAERGTALHTAMALLIDNARSLDGLAGEIISGYTITRDDVETALRPAYAYVDALLDTPGAEFYFERRVAFPTIPGAFGTTDLLVRIGAPFTWLTSSSEPACVCSRFILPAMMTSSTRRLCSTPRPGAIRFANCLPVSRTSS
jgi:hypothetical protein